MSEISAGCMSIMEKMKILFIVTQFSYRLSCTTELGFCPMKLFLLPVPEQFCL